MMDNFIEPIERLVNAFRSLPGVGLKTAQRYAYYIINSDREVAEEFANALISAKDKVRFCSVCDIRLQSRRPCGGRQAGRYIFRLLLPRRFVQ